MKRIVVWACVVAIALSNVAFVMPAFAADTTPNGQLKAALYAKALAYCFANNDLQSNQLFGHQYISADSIESGNWFGTHGGGHALRAYYSGDGTGKDCTDPGWVRESISLLGFKSGRDALKAYGLNTEPSGDMYFTVPREAIGRSLIQNAAKGYGSEPSLTSPEAQYLLYYKLMYSPEGCNAQHTDETAIADGANGGRFKVINPSPPPDTKDESVLFQSKADDTQVVEYNNVDGRSQISCQEIANRINSYAGQAANGLRSANQLPTPASVSGNGGASGPTCNITAVGWIVCPVVNFFAKITDASYSGVRLMLDVPSIEMNGSSDGQKAMFDAWSGVRNIANVAFVIAFMFIIYSQVSGAGINNYGIKRLLPKLLLSALMVNLSYWICAIAVDVSNVLGRSTWQILNNAADNVISQGTWAGGGTTGISTTFSIIAGGVMTAATLPLISLSILLPMLIGCLLVIATTFIALTVRQALIVIFVIISPLAFVAYLLPNTEGYAKKYWSLFTKMLFMYAAVSLIFGGSAIASKVLTSMGASGAGGGSQNWPMQIAGAATSIIPLIVVPTFLKTASSLVGRVMNNNPARGLIDRSKNAAERRGKMMDNQRALKALDGKRFFGNGRFRRKAKLDAKEQSLQRFRQNREQRYAANEAVDADGNATRYGRQLAGANILGSGANESDIKAALANAQFTISEASAQEVKAARVTFEEDGINAGKAAKALEEDSEKYSESEKIALRQKVVEGGNAADIAKIWDSMEGATQRERNDFAVALQKNKPTGIGMGDIAAMQGGATINEKGEHVRPPNFRQALANGIVAKRFDAAGAAKSDNSELDLVHEILKSESSNHYIEEAVVKANKNAEKNNTPEKITSISEVFKSTKEGATKAIEDPRFNAGKARTSLEPIRDIEIPGGAPTSANHDEPNITRTVPTPNTPAPSTVTATPTVANAATAAAAPQYTPHFRTSPDGQLSINHDTTDTNDNDNPNGPEYHI